MDSQIRNRVFALLTKIPKGKVSTYGQIAKKAGIKSARTVGQIIHKNIDTKKYPCHRVVRSDGTIAAGYAFGGQSAQIKKLKEEGIEVNKNKINLNKYQVKSSLL